MREMAQDPGPFLMRDASLLFLGGGLSSSYLFLPFPTAMVPAPVWLIGSVRPIALRTTFPPWKLSTRNFGPCFGGFLDKSGCNACPHMQKLSVQLRSPLLAAALSFLGCLRCRQCKLINVHKVVHGVENTRVFKEMVSLVYLEEVS